MESLISFLQNKVSDALALAFNLSSSEIIPEITPCVQEKFGHYQCNSSFSLAKRFNKNPKEVAHNIIDSLDLSAFLEVSVAGGGFVNFTFSNVFISARLQAQMSDRLLGAYPPTQKEKIIVEFSSPNVAKELHVGHLRSTIIGDCLARLFEFLGQDVVRLNHIGDWGTQFGMLIAYAKEMSLLSMGREQNLGILMEWYRSAKKKFDEDPLFKKQAQLEVLRLQGGEKESLLIWKTICDASRKAFQEIYELLDIKIEERGESFYNPELQNIVDAFKEKHLSTISDGAECVYLDGFKNRDGNPLPLMIRKSDGGYNYDTTDLAAIRHRIFADKADRIIYVTDAGQSLHFQMIFAAAEKIGWLDRKKTRVDHVGFGLVLGADGKKLKTRSGVTEKLIDLLKEAVSRAREMLEARELVNFSVAEIESLASVLGIDAVKYADLSSHRTKDYTFSYEKMLRFEGNTATFLLYSYVRINGIKKKSALKIAQLMEQCEIEILHPSEISLGLHLCRFGEVLDGMTRDLLPNRLTDYLYLLAEKFNAFFRDCRVIGDEKEGSRLILCELTAKVLGQGLNILGLKIVDRM